MYLKFFVRPSAARSPTILMLERLSTRTKDLKHEVRSPELHFGGGDGEWENDMRNSSSNETSLKCMRDLNERVERNHEYTRGCVARFCCKRCRQTELRLTIHLSVVCDTIHFGCRAKSYMSGIGALGALRRASHLKSSIDHRRSQDLSK